MTADGPLRRLGEAHGIEVAGPDALTARAGAAL
jgi:hypothetical protein